jgi:hypothetical protein
MGADIHCYIEYRKRNDSGEKRWLSFGGRLNPGRNYGVFAVLAGIRSDKSIPVPFPPRGLPEDTGFKAVDDYYLFIDETGFENSVTSETAKQYVENCGCHYKNNHDGKPTWVSHPDWHSHSWLTTEELKKVFQEYLKLEEVWFKERIEKHEETIRYLENTMKESGKTIPIDSWVRQKPEMYIEPEYQAVIAAMERFETLGYDSRLVFWFDN